LTSVITAQRTEWGAVYAMALCSFALVASEFMPVSLLSPIAHDLRLTEGQAGQAISISGLFAVLTSLFVTVVAGKADRRIVLLVFAALLIVSGTTVAAAPSYPVLMLGRAVVGIAIGGFWSMSAATAMRLVPARSVPAALAIINGGNAVASTVAAPLGSLLGGLIGWRGAFFCVVPVALGAVIWLALSLPSLPAGTARDGRRRALLRRPSVLAGLLTVSLFFMGQFALYTYLRPFLEQVTHVGLSALSAMLLVVGVAGFIGSSVIGRVLDRRLSATLGVLPGIMAAVAFALAVFGGSPPATAVLLAVWGFAGTAAPVAWWTWLTRAAPDDAEAGGGLMVAVVQTAITFGATLGGIIFDALGPVADVLGSGVILAVAALAACCGASAARAEPT
jgi:predicted MFS family arabinose efflux permease